MPSRAAFMEPERHITANDTWAALEFMKNQFKVRASLRLHVEHKEETGCPRKEVRIVR